METLTNEAAQKIKGLVGKYCSCQTGIWITKSFHKEELLGITFQLRRATLSIPLNIAEGAARSTKKEFVRFLDIAIASLSEVDTIFIIAFELNYLNESDFESLTNQLDQIGKLMYGLKKSLVSKM